MPRRKLTGAEKSGSEFGIHKHCQKGDAYHLFNTSQEMLVFVGQLHGV